MAVSTNKMGPGKLTIGAAGDLTSFESQITSCRLVPSVDNGDAIKVLSGESVAGDRTETWTLEGTFLQDLGALVSRSEWLFTNRGETHVFEFEPSTAGGKKFTGSLVVESGEFGGDVDGSQLTSDFTFQLVGDPVLVPVV